jgi:hypothetical protein
MEVTDEQGAVLEPLIPEPLRSRNGRGRLWRYSEGGAQLRTVGAEDGGSLARSAQPLSPPYHTSRRRFQRWVRDGMMRSALEALAEDLEERGGLGLSECFIDATFVVANRGRAGGKDQAGQGYEAHGRGRPLWPSSLRLRGEYLSAQGHPF